MGSIWQPQVAVPCVHVRHADRAGGDGEHCRLIGVAVWDRTKAMQSLGISGIAGLAAAMIWLFLRGSADRPKSAIRCGPCWTSTARPLATPARGVATDRRSSRRNARHRSCKTGARKRPLRLPLGGPNRGDFARISWGFLTSGFRGDIIIIKLSLSIAPGRGRSSGSSATGDRTSDPDLPDGAGPASEMHHAIRCQFNQTSSLQLGQHFSCATRRHHACHPRRR